MAQYKVTKVFVVEAASKPDAIDKVTSKPGETLEFVSVQEQPSGKANGWLGTIKTQVSGK